MHIDPASTKSLRGTVAEIESIQTAIVELSDRDDDGWRRDLIALRRRLQQQISKISQLLDVVEFNVEDTRQLRRAFSQMRSNVALLQANWPAVAIDRDDISYRMSLRDVRAANRAFILLVTTVLARRQQA